MLMVNALAGTGKTTTVLWGAGGRVPSDISVSGEQKAVIKEMRKHRGTIAACAFNRSIAMELKERAPAGVECGTSNSFGHRAWCSYVGSGNLSPDAMKSRKLCSELIGQTMPWKEKMRIQTAVAKIISLCKGYLFDPCAESRTNWAGGGDFLDGVGIIKWLCDRFDIDDDPVIIDYAKRTFIKGVEAKGYIDWDDQIFMPIYYDISLPVYDHLIVDEVQDLNRAKQELAFRMGRYLTCVGDVHQSIYAFSGADSEAMLNLRNRMFEVDRNSKELTLTITRRCPKNVVALANHFVPELKAADEAPDGLVSDISNKEFHDMQKGEPCMIVCRKNAPLTSLAFNFIGRGIRCYIQGRDLGAGLKAEIARTGESSLTAALAKVHDRIDRKKIEISMREFYEEAQIEELNDKMRCINVLAANASSISEFNDTVDKLFKDSGSSSDIRLSSVHKAKGLEHDRVFIYNANELQLKAKKAYQAQQERNLAYVAYTRSKNELYLVSSKNDESSDTEDGYESILGEVESDA